MCIRDSSLVTKNTFDAGPQAVDASVNDDIFSNIFDIISEAKLTVTVLWMPSHSDEDKTKKDKLPNWCTPYYVAGNKQADRLADVAARYAQIPESVAKPVRLSIDGCRQIQLRLATIVSALPGRPRLDLPKPPVIPRVTIQDLIDTSMHNVVHNSTNNRLTLSLIHI